MISDRNPTERSGREDSKIPNAYVKTVRLPVAASDAESSVAEENCDERERPPSPPSRSPSKRILNQWFSCAQCAFKARNKKIVDDHERTAHYEPDDEEEDAERELEDEEEDEEENSDCDSKKRNRRYTCEKCGFVTDDANKLRQHCKIHPAKAGREERFCPKCDFKTNYRWSLERHERYHALNGGHYKCSLCDYSSFQHGSVKFHTNNHHFSRAYEGKTAEILEVTKNMDNNGKDHDDSMPGEMEGSSIGIDENSQETDAVTCDLCGACFLNHVDLLEHSKKEHINEIEAEQAQTFRRDRSLVSANVASSSSSAAVAPVAGSSDETLQRLQNRFGLSITPVTGNSGGEAAASSEQKKLVVIELGNGKSLKHLIEGTTNGAEPKKPQSRSGTIFKCRYCPFSTKTKLDYQKHETTHKALSCQFCSFKTVWKNDLVKHLSKAHNQDEATPDDSSTAEEPIVPDEGQGLPPASGGVLRNLLSTPEAPQTKESPLLFKTLQKSEFAPLEKGAARGKCNQEDICNHSLKLPPNAHYFCPYCSFMTKTASRFHIHYMQHLNVRPFECSVCRIKSNWLWDINKHIRVRLQHGDKDHEDAKCVCINEAGLRDYNKYRCFIKEGPANGEHIETSYEQAEIEVMNSQGQVHPTYSSSEPSTAQPATPQAVAPVTSVNNAEDSQNYIIQQLQKTERSSLAKNLKCAHCDYICDHKDIMLGHLGAHADVLPFICSRCGLANKWHHTAWIHLQQFHRNENITLKDIHLQLEYQQKDGVYLLDPARIVNKELSVAPNSEVVGLIKQLRCSRCPYHTVQKSNMQRHNEGHARNRLGMQYKCPYCNFWQETRRAIQRHMVIHPEHVKRGPQGVLDTKTSPISDGSLIIKDCHPYAIDVRQQIEETPDSGNQSFKCDACPFEATFSTQFIYHKQFHRYNPKAKFKCTQCSYWATHAHLITQHARLHNEGTSNQKFPQGSWLPTAEIAVTTENVLSDRIRSFRVVKNGVPLKMFKCRFCPLMNRRKSNIRFHEGLHDDMANGKYTCHLCSYSTDTQKGLGTHMKVHLTGKKSSDSVEVELIDEVGDSSSEDDGPEQVLIVGTDPVEDPAPQTAQRIKYNCSAVESELFNLLQNRQNGSTTITPVVDDPKPPPSSQTPGLARVKKTPKAMEPFVRRSDGLTTFQSVVSLRKWIACSECPALFMNPTEYSRHLDHHRLSDKFRCSQCSYSMNKSLYVVQHEQVHTDDYMLKKLGYCHRSITGAGDESQTLLDNIPTSAPLPVVSNNNVQCTVNNNNTPILNGSTNGSVSSGHAYKVITRTPKKPIGIHVAISEEASANFDNEDYNIGLLIAELHESRAVVDGISPGNHRCSVCPAAFSNQGVFQFHMTLHQGAARRYKCHVCSYSTNETANMSAHAQVHYGLIRTAHRSGVKQCPKCPAKFTKQSYYESHLPRHGSGAKYRCEHCDFATTKCDILARHRILHKQHWSDGDFANGEENLDSNSQISVSTLFRNASVPQTLVEDAKPMNLDEALESSGSERSEDDKRLYVCSACPYSYARRDGLVQHMKRHTTQQQFVCPHCSFMVNNAGTLREHIKTHFVGQKFVRPQAFLHYEDLKIKVNGEVIFEDRGRRDEIRFHPEIIPVFNEQPSEVLVDYIKQDVFDVVTTLVDEICEDRRKMDREIQSSSIYGQIVRRSNRSSQDEPPAKRSRNNSSDKSDSASRDGMEKVRSNGNTESILSGSQAVDEDDAVTTISNQESLMSSEAQGKTLQPELNEEEKNETPESAPSTNKEEEMPMKETELCAKIPNDNQHPQDRLFTTSESHETSETMDGIEEGPCGSSNDHVNEDGVQEESDAQHVLNTIVSNVAQSMLHV